MAFKPLSDVPHLAAIEKFRYGQRCVGFSYSMKSPEDFNASNGARILLPAEAREYIAYMEKEIACLNHS